MELPDEWKFLGKVNFWTMVMASAAGVLLFPDFATVPWYVNLARFLTAVGAGFTIAQKIDRNFGDKRVEAAKIEADYPSKEAAKVL